MEGMPMHVVASNVKHIASSGSAGEEERQNERRRGVVFVRTRRACSTTNDRNALISCTLSSVQIDGTHGGWGIWQ